MEETIAPTENAASAAVAVEAPAPTESSTVETNTSAPVTESPAPAAPVEAPAAETNEPESQPRSRSAKGRIGELVQENKRLKDQISSVPIPQAPLQAPKLSELVQGREQLMPEELDQLGQKVYQDAAQATEGRVNLRLAQMERNQIIKDAIRDTEVEASRLTNEYGELNPNDPTYNQVLDQKIVNRYQSEVVRRNPYTGALEFDPSIKLANVAKEEVEFYRQATEAGKAQSSAALASQADMAAVTPTSATPAPDKSFSEMSLKEQETYLRNKGHDI